MRCKACDTLLTDFEATIKLASTGDFLDLCAKCRSFIAPSLDTVERYDLYDPDLDTIEFATETEEGSPLSSERTDDEQE